MKACLSTAIGSETLESHLECHDIVRACLSMAGGTLESLLEGHDIVKVCLSRASATMEFSLQGQGVVKVCLSMACEMLGSHQRDAGILLCPFRSIARTPLESHLDGHDDCVSDSFRKDREASCRKPRKNNATLLISRMFQSPVNLILHGELPAESRAKITQWYSSVAFPKALST